VAVITSFDAYHACLNSVFRLARPGGPDLELSLVAANQSIDNDVQRTFSLIFRGPQELLPQGSYRLQHDELKEIELFLVPLGRWKGGDVRYEAVFNLVKGDDALEA
jgi:uncharacterized protein DUF6916